MHHSGAIQNYSALVVGSFTIAYSTVYIGKISECFYPRCFDIIGQTYSFALDWNITHCFGVSSCLLSEVA